MTEEEGNERILDVVRTLIGKQHHVQGSKLLFFVYLYSIRDKRVL